jgi:glucosamine-6-phosphate deaminase
LIEEAGGIDIQILGIGRTGSHRLQRAWLGEREPHAADHARPGHADGRGERLLRRVERAARAITMGVGTILGARRVFMLAFGEHKAPIVAQKAVEGEITESVAASFLQEHPERAGRA